MIKKEGAGRVRLANGARMSYGAFVETMMENFPHAPVEPDWQLDELAVKVEEIEAKVKRMTPMLALDRAARFGVRRLSMARSRPLRSERRI